MSSMWPDYEGSANPSKSKLYRYYPNTRTPNTTLIRTPEPFLEQIVFDKHIFHKNTDKPVVLLSCLVEFGCESLLPHYFIPDFLEKTNKFHRIAVGWRGRKLFYKDFDEFWEIDDRYMFLRDYCLAFTNVSRNINNLENALKQYGQVIPSKLLGNRFHEKVCKKCRTTTLPLSSDIRCNKCNSIEFFPSLLEDPIEGKKHYKKLNLELEKYDSYFDKIFTKNTIGIFARNRTTYGRNLPEIFYIEFIKNLKAKNYDSIWLGEKQSTLKCPVSDIYDFTKTEYSDNLEVCLGLVARCVGTFQAWTASTRFSQIMDIPFCLVESTDQLQGRGHEGKRLELLTQDKKKSKIIISNYLNSKDNLDKFLEICIFNFLDFIENKNSNTVVGIL